MYRTYSWHQAAVSQVGSDSNVEANEELFVEPHGWLASGPLDSKFLVSPWIF